LEALQAERLRMNQESNLNVRAREQLAVSLSGVIPESNPIEPANREVAASFEEDVLTALESLSQLSDSTRMEIVAIEPASSLGLENQITGPSSIQGKPSSKTDPWSSIFTDNV